MRYICGEIYSMNRIKEVIEEKGIRQTWLAEKLGKSYNMINSYVQNRQQPRLEVLDEIAQILGVDIKDLLKGKADLASDKLTFIDLFAGCGGLSEGFLSSERFEALAHVEWELPMVNTLRSRLRSKWKHSEDDSIKRVVHFDIQKTQELINGNWSDESIQNYAKNNHEFIINYGLNGLIENRKVDLIIGGPPCQAYSIAGRAQDKNSMKDDYRNYLFESFVKVVDAFKPKVFVFENVPGLLSASPGNIPVTKRIYEAFKAIGYEIRTPDGLNKSIYTASDFGVPQKRNRVIIIGVKKKSGLDLEELYNQINHFKGKINSVSVKDSIKHLPELIPLTEKKKQNGKNISHSQLSKSVIKYHEPRYHNERDIAIFKKWVTNNMNKKPMLEKIDFYNNLMGKKSNHAKYRNLEWEKPSPTIVAHLYKDGLMFIHPDPNQARSITIKEASLLQSFPDDYEFVGSSGDCFKMIGNAVPPEMAKYIALGIAKYIEKVNDEKK
jgi:DNA (cytosine-5)-methyltransferase 1